MSAHDASDSDATVFGGDLGPKAPAPADPDRTVFADEVPPPASPPAAPAADPDSTVYDPEQSPLASPPPRAPPPTDPGDRSDPTYDQVDRTAHAMAAMELGALFNHRFALARFGVSPRYRLELVAPDGPSTGGGARARQSIVMYPDGRRKDRAVVIGFVDAPKAQAELRTYALAGRIFEARFKRPIDMVESEYERLCDELRRFADTQGLRIRMRDEDAAPDARGEAAPEPAGRTLALRQVVFLAASLVLAGVLIGYILAH